ncbi:MAG: molybdopterin-dependent oxidoreductase [Pseudomonadota bacterium]
MSADVDTRRLTASHWGPGVARTAGGRLISISPHPDDPDPSQINENIAGSLNGRARVLRPAVRRGYLENGPGACVDARGREPFVEVDWDTALDLVAREHSRISREHGNQAIFGGSYGWASAGRFHHAQSQLKRFLNAAGGFTSSDGNYSYQAALVLLPHIVGNFREQVKQATRWSTVAREGSLVVMFGGVPLRTVQISGGGLGRHRIGADMAACARAGVSFVNISPLRTDAADALDAEWLAPRPGTDTAIMMGLAHTLLVEGLCDRGFLSRCTVGFERLESYVLGATDGVAKTADWAAELSGLDPDRLRRLAREMASRRTLITTAAGLQRADYGEQPLWMTVALASMLGQIGLPGGGYGIAYGADDSIGTMDQPMKWPSLPQGTNPVDTVIPVAMIADMLLAPNEPYACNGETRVFPDIKMIWWAGGNPFHHHQDLNRLRDAFQRPETIVINEINWTATARHADIVLPVAAPQERVDFGAGKQDNMLLPMPKLVDPPGEARCEYHIYCALEERLNLGDAFSKGRDVGDWLEAMWSDLQATGNARGVAFPSFAEFLEGEPIEVADPSPNAVFLAEFRADPEGHPLRTPSGRIELFSETIASFGYEECPGHAVWFPPRAWQTGATEQWPLHMISGQPETRLHSQLDNGDFSVSKKVAGREPVLIHPDDAAARGISSGDVVVVENQMGRCLAGAVVTTDIRHGAIFLWTGAWYDPDFSDPRQTDRHGNPNVLTTDNRTSRLSQGPSAHSSYVEVTRFEGDPPPVEAFDPPLFVDPPG